MQKLIKWILNSGYNLAGVEFDGCVWWYLFSEFESAEQSGALPSNFVSLRGIQVTDFIQKHQSTMDEKTFVDDFSKFLDNIQKDDYLGVKFSPSISYKLFVR